MVHVGCIENQLQFIRETFDKALIEKDASYEEKAKFDSVAIAICVETRSHILLCMKCFW